MCQHILVGPVKVPTNERTSGKKPDFRNLKKQEVKCIMSIMSEITGREYNYPSDNFDVWLDIADMID